MWLISSNQDQPQQKLKLATARFIKIQHLQFHYLWQLSISLTAMSMRSDFWSFMIFFLHRLVKISWRRSCPIGLEVLSWFGWGIMRVIRFPEFLKYLPWYFFFRSALCNVVTLKESSIVPSAQQWPWTNVYDKNAFSDNFLRNHYVIVFLFKIFRNTAHVRSYADLADFCWIDTGCMILTFKQD